MVWLKQGIATRRLIIIDAKALIHAVSETAHLVSPGVIQCYVQEHPQVGKNGQTGEPAGLALRAEALRTN